MNVFTVFLALCFLYVCANGQDKDWTKLTLKSGAIRGRKVVTARNTTAFLFQGIPFAEPPTGDLRFRAPVAKKAWKGELLTNDYKFTCLFTTIMVKDDPMARNMSEDCLHINVFTTEKCLDKKNCPVLYYIHGGSWNFDSPFLFADDFLIDNYQSRDIVLVTLTYRMGSFGFFNTVKKSSADKNLGLLDIILGLQWTQNEIGAFGGDKNRVSIMGHSSGAQGVDQLAISPKTAGLFRQVIVMSGPVGMIELRRDANLNQSRTMAISAGCATEDLWNAGDSFEEILQCLRRKPVAELVNVQREIENTGQSFEGPMIDDADGVLPENSTALLRKRRPYQMLIGTTNREFRVAAMLVNSDGEISKPLLYIMCIFMAKTRGLKHPLAVGRACADDYSKRPSDIPDLVDDVLIYLPTYDSSEAMRAKKAVVYKYSFEYSKIGEAFLGKEASSVPGPFHAQDLVYVMGLHYNKFTPKDQQIRKVYSGVFADFVISGDPSPPTHREKWQPTDDRNNYFRIDFDDNMNMPGNADGYHAGAVQLWTKGAPEVDAFFSKWDVNGTFSLKKLLLDVIRGLKERGVNIDQQLIDDVSSWSDDPKDFDQSDIEHIAKVLRDLFGRMQELNDDDDDDNLRRSIVNQFSNQVVRKSLPTVRDTAVNASGATTWQTWFWIAAGVAAILAALLLLTCCTACYQRSKQAKNEWLGETSRLNPSSSKMYG